jgi:hypothetical protein
MIAKDFPPAKDLPQMAASVFYLAVSGVSRPRCRPDLRVFLPHRTIETRPGAGTTQYGGAATCAHKEPSPPTTAGTRLLGKVNLFPAAIRCFSFVIM